MKFIPTLILALTTTSASAFDCLPQQWAGTGTQMHYESTGKGLWAAWLCPIDAARTQWKPQSWAALHSIRPESTLSTMAYAALTAPPTSLDALNALVGKASIVPAAGTEQAWFDELLTAAQAWNVANVPAAPASAPPAKTWLVAANGTANTRNCYTWDGQTLAATSTCRATVAQPCSNAASATRSGGTYMAFGPTFRTDRLTLCELK